MAGYLGTRAVLLSTTAATVTGDMTVAGDATVSGTFTSLGIDDNATSTAITIDASENVGIGVVPESWAIVSPALSVGKTSIAAYSSGTRHFSYLFNNLYYDGTNDRYIADGKGGLFQIVDSEFKWFQAGTGTAGSTGALTERMQIDASGNVIIGKTVTTSQSVAGIVLYPDGGIACTTSNSGTQYPLSFARGGAYVGTVATSASATSYNTYSDYRLKENVTPIQGAADTVMAMQPCTYTAIVDGVWYDGFLAHELQEVHPRAVQGTKDAMRDEEYEVTPATETEEAVMGTRSVPDMQSVDYSKLTPILTAALQEALTEIAALKVRVAALEATP